MPPWLKPPHHHALGRNAQLGRSRLNGLRHHGTAVGLLLFVDAARTTARLDRKVKPGVRARPHAVRRAQAQHMKALRNLRRQAEQVLLVAAHAVHQHQQPGPRGARGGRAL